MTNSLDTTIRRVGLVLSVGAGSIALFVGSAAAADDRPAASFYTPQQLQAISQSWAARGGVFVNRPAASFYTPQQLQAISQSWAARGGVFVNRPAASFYTPQQLQAISQSWAARATSPVIATPTRSQSSFDWADFGAGAGAMLGAVLLAGGLGAAIHYGRRGSVRTRPV
jgi:hypothetical protein